MTNWALRRFISIGIGCWEASVRSGRKSMSEYWSRRFAQEGMIWGSEPSPTAQAARNIFRQHNVKSILVPGSGYGRNTKVFSEEFKTFGVELSVEALKMATEWDSRSHFFRFSARLYFGRKGRCHLLL